MFKEGKTRFYTRRVNQDYAENFFGFVRQRCGCNDNPTAHQLKATVRRFISLLLADEELTSASRGANCQLALDDTEETAAPSTSLKVPEDGIGDGIEDASFCEDDDLPADPVPPPQEDLSPIEEEEEEYVSLDILLEQEEVDLQEDTRDDGLSLGLFDR